MSVQVQPGNGGPPATDLPPDPPTEEVAAPAGEASAVRTEDPPPVGVGTPPPPGPLGSGGDPVAATLQEVLSDDLDLSAWDGESTKLPERWRKVGDKLGEWGKRQGSEAISQLKTELAVTATERDRYKRWYQDGITADKELEEKAKALEAEVTQLRARVAEIDKGTQTWKAQVEEWKTSNKDLLDDPVTQAVLRRYLEAKYPMEKAADLTRQWHQDAKVLTDPVGRALVDRLLRGGAPPELAATWATKGRGVVNHYLKLREDGIAWEKVEHYAKMQSGGPRPEATLLDGGGVVHRVEPPRETPIVDFADFRSRKLL